MIIVYLRSENLLWIRFRVSVARPAAVKGRSGRKSRVTCSVPHIPAALASYRGDRAALCPRRRMAHRAGEPSI